MVRLYSTSTVNYNSSNIDDTLYTDFEGKCVFNCTRILDKKHNKEASLAVEVALLNMN